MYVVPPPERSGSASDAGDLRVYQTWKGSNVSSLFLFLIFIIWFLLVLELLCLITLPSGLALS